MRLPGLIVSAHCEVNVIRSLSSYGCGITSHLVRECPMPAGPPQAPANNRVKQHGNDNNTSNNGSNNGNIQDALTAITQTLQALTTKIDKMHTPTQKLYHTNNYNKSHGHNRPHNNNRQHHSRLLCKVVWGQVSFMPCHILKYVISLICICFICFITCYMSSFILLSHLGDLYVLCFMYIFYFFFLCIHYYFICSMIYFILPHTTTTHFQIP